MNGGGRSVMDIGGRMVEDGADELADGGFWILDNDRTWGTQDGVVLFEEFYSPLWFNSMGYGDKELPYHSGAWLSLITPEDGERAWQMFLDYTEGRIDNYEITVTYTKKDGSNVRVICSGTTLKHGKRSFLIGSHVIL